MEKMSDLCKDPQFRAFEELFLDVCREYCSTKEFRCSRELARVKIEEIFRATRNSAINEINHETEESNRRSHRIEVAGGIIVLFGAAASNILGRILADPKIAVGGMILGGLVGTAVCVAAKLTTPVDDIRTRTTNKLQAIVDRPEEYFDGVKPNECVA